MAFWPDLLYQLLPGFGLFAACGASIYLVVMRKQMDGILLGVYFLHLLDLLLGLSLFYAGFHGILLSVYSDQEEQTTPFHCLFSALHLHIWLLVDSAQLLLLALLCCDQFISVVWTKRHKELSERYFNLGCLLLLVSLSAGLAFVPAWMQPVLLSDNHTVRVSPFCEMKDTFGQPFYDVQLEVRKWAPLADLLSLLLTGLLLFGFQVVQKFRFKWSDNNRQSARFFLFVFVRALLTALSVHLPLAQLRRAGLPVPREDVHFLRELFIRLSQVFIFGLIQPVLDALLLPQFLAKIAEFFNLKEVKRTWQSADDPPLPARSIGTSGWDMFGSFHSTGGNVIGEAGIPLELNADVQRSISFYYNDLDD